MKNFTTNHTNLFSRILSWFVLVRVGSRFLILLFFLLISAACTRDASVQTPALVTWSGAYPTAILQTGTFPIWFQLTEDGPVHIDSIEDVTETFAFTPWTYAVHIRYFMEGSDGIVMVVNRDGFLKLTPGDNRGSSVAMYRFPGGNFWRQYTVGGFINFEDNPTALLYLDERFLTSDTPLPQHKTWSFNMNANTPFPLDVPAIQLFPVEEGWDVDSLRLATDGFYYYRAARRSGASPLLRMFRSTDLSKAGEEVSIETFYNSSPRETVFSHHSYPSLPQLPEGFVYTGIGRVGNSLFASWEEQEDFSIGAAGFVIIRR